MKSNEWINERMNGWMSATRQIGDEYIININRLIDGNVVAPINESIMMSDDEMAGRWREPNVAWLFGHRHRRHRERTLSSAPLVYQSIKVLLLPLLHFIFSSSWGWNELPCPLFLPLSPLKTAICHHVECRFTITVNSIHWWCQLECCLASIGH